MSNIKIYVIPADTDKPMEFRTIPNTLEAMQEVVKGYLEVLSSKQTLQITPREVFERGQYVALVVNEEAALRHGFECNIRAGLLFPYGTIRGDVFLVLSGFHSFQSLPFEFEGWEGPGHKLPVDTDAGV